MISGKTIYKDNSEGSFNFKYWKTLKDMINKEQNLIKIYLFYDVKKWNTQIRKIETPTKDYKRYIIEVGIFESLGEQGGDILTLTYDKFPNKKEIIEDVINYYEDLAKEFYNSDGELMLNLSYREEQQVKCLTKLKGGLR